MILSEPDSSTTLYLDQVQVQFLLLSQLSISELLIDILVKGKL
jgi:hypothetical protein